MFFLMVKNLQQQLKAQKRRDISSLCNQTSTNSIEEKLLWSSKRNMGINAELSKRIIKINTGKFNPPYQTKNKFSTTEALNQLYATFINYGKKGYETVKTNTKKVMGNVKLTLTKIVKLGEYIMAATTPQWNMPYGSKFDRDTLAQTVSPQDSISEEDAKYQVGYQYLKYRG